MSLVSMFAVCSVFDILHCATQTYPRIPQLTFLTHSDTPFLSSPPLAIRVPPLPVWSRLDIPHVSVPVFVSVSLPNRMYSPSTRLVLYSVSR